MHFDSLEKSFLFLGVFNPWEVVCVCVCLRDYMTRTYANLYETYAAVLSKRSSSRTYLSDYSCTENLGFFKTALEPDDVFVKEYIERCMSRGLPYLQTILQASPSRQEHMLRDHIKEMCEFLTGALEENTYDFSYRTQRYLHWINETEERFTSDTVDEPNAAWLWSTGNKCEILYNLKPDLSKWG